MTGVVSTYIFYAPEGFQMDYQPSMMIGSFITLLITGWYVYQIVKQKQLRKNKPNLKAA